MRRTASRPPMPGMTRSMSTTSGFRARVCLTASSRSPPRHHAEVGFAIEQCVQPGADRPVIVGEQDVDRLGRGGGRLRPERSSHGPPYRGAWVLR